MSFRLSLNNFAKKPQVLNNALLSLFDPSEIDGSKIWLRADSIDDKNANDTISVWENLAIANDATQTSETLKPTYQIVDTKPVVRWNDSNDRMSFGNESQFDLGFNSLSAIVLIKRTAQGSIFSKGINTVGGYQLQAGGYGITGVMYRTDANYYQGGVPIQAITNDFQVWEYYIDRENLQLKTILDGVEIQSVNIADDSGFNANSTSLAQVGTYFNGVNGFVGDMKAFYLNIRESILSAAERTNIKNLMVTL